jgi:hypothetical protein
VKLSIFKKLDGILHFTRCSLDTLEKSEKKSFLEDVFLYSPQKKEKTQPREENLGSGGYDITFQIPIWL